MSKELHILFLSSWYPSRVTPTDGNFVNRHAEAISLLHKVTAIHAVGDVAMTEQIYEVSDRKNKNVRNIIVYFKKHRFSFGNFIRRYKALKKALSLVENFDIIHANVIFPIGIFVSLLNIKYRKPILYTEHWSGYLNPKESQLGWLKKRAIRYFSSKASAVVPVSKSLKNAMQKMGVKANFHVIGNATDTRIFTPKIKNNTTFKILHISTLDNEQKNIEGLLEVFAKISHLRSDFIFQVIGDKNLENAKAIAKAKQIPTKLIEFHGTKTPEQIAEFMQKANLYVSFSNRETFGVVYVEALASGTPVVATNTGILTEFQIENAYKIAAVKDQDSLQKHILNYMDKVYTIDVENMREFAVSNFSFDAISKKYDTLYQSIISNDKS